MADMLRPDGKPFVTDNRNAIPRYVVELDGQGRVVVRNQFTCVSVVASETKEHTRDQVRAAMERLRMKEWVVNATDAELLDD
jgi:hypothetical protein